MLMNYAFAWKFAFLQDSCQLFYGLVWLTLCWCHLKMHVVGEGPGAALSVLRHFLSLISSLLIGIFLSQRKAMPKNAQTTTQLHSSHMLKKVMLKILQARLQQYVNHELPDVQAGFRKGRGTRDGIANICWIIKNAREFPKNIYFCFTDYAKAFDCGWQ